MILWYIFSQKTHSCASNYFQYLFHIIQQITDSLVFHFLRKTKSSFGNRADDDSEGIAVATMRNGKANGILEGWGKCDDIEWQGNCIHAGLVEVSLGIISCVEVGITASCSLFKIFQGFIIFFLRICFSSCKALNINTPQKRKRPKETNWKQKFQKPKMKTSA